jgi:hypothetical protein
MSFKPDFKDYSRFLLSDVLREKRLVEMEKRIFQIDKIVPTKQTRCKTSSMGNE